MEAQGQVIGVINLDCDVLGGFTEADLALLVRLTAEATTVAPLPSTPSVAPAATVAIASTATAPAAPNAEPPPSTSPAASAPAARGASVGAKPPRATAPFRVDAPLPRSTA